MPHESPASAPRPGARNHHRDLRRSESPSSRVPPQPWRSAHRLRGKRQPADCAPRTIRAGAWNTWDRPPFREFLATQARTRDVPALYSECARTSISSASSFAWSFFQKCHRRGDSRTGSCAGNKIGPCHWPLWLKGVVQVVLSLFKPLGCGASHAHRRALSDLGAVGKRGAKRYRCRYVPCRVGAQALSKRKRSLFAPRHWHGSIRKRRAGHS